VVVLKKLSSFGLTWLVGLALIIGTPFAVAADSTATAQITVACSDGTTITVPVDPSTLIDSTGEVQALNPGGLACAPSQDLLTTDNTTATATSDSITCTPTTFMQDGRPLTALLINPAFVNVAVDAQHACDIAVYYTGGFGGTVDGATISNAIYYGVLDDNSTGEVDVKNSSIQNIGDAAFDGSQHGVGVSYIGSSSNGIVDNNSISQYQKNGMAMKNGANVTVTNNTVTGRGRTKVIAQNGIEFVSATSPNLSGNTVSMNIYTQTTSCAPGCVGSTTGVTATGFLLYNTNFKNPGEVAPFNHAFRNQVDYFVKSS
jgi:parallel beta-helix repeat protein